MRKGTILLFLSITILGLFVFISKIYAVEQDCKNAGGSCQISCDNTNIINTTSCTDAGTKKICCKASNSSGLGCGGGLGPFAQLFCDSAKDPETGSEIAGNQLNTLISGFISIMTLVSSLWFIIQFIIAGFEWITAAGDKNMLQTARYKILNAIIGLVIVAAAWVLIGVIGRIIGLDLLNPGQVLQGIGL